MRAQRHSRVVGESGRVRKNITIALLNIIKSSRDRVVGDIIGVDEAEAIMRVPTDSDNRVSVRGKSKVNILLKVLESERESQL